MNTKIKSLIYLSCFIFASVVYNLSTEEVTSKKEIATHTAIQEPDVIINPYLEPLEQLKTN